MKSDNPIVLKIKKQQAEIKEEVVLKKKKHTINKLVFSTSLLLVSGTIIGLIRILSSMFQ